MINCDKLDLRLVFAATVFFLIRNVNAASNKSKQQLSEIADWEVLKFSVTFLFYTIHNVHLKFISTKGKTFCFTTPIPFRLPNLFDPVLPLIDVNITLLQYLHRYINSNFFRIINYINFRWLYEEYSTALWYCSIN